MPATTSKIVSGKTTFRSTYADSNALWRVVKKKSKDCYLCEIVNEPVEFEGKVLDGDYAGVQKVFMDHEIQNALGMQDFWNKIHNDHDAFYDSLRIGQIVHYHNGFGTFVRCEVSVDKQLKPLALVGNWRSHDLPRRLATGEIEGGYWYKRIVDKELSKPNATNIWEFYRNADPKRIPAGMNCDPTSMKPIDLQVPEMTEEQKHVAELWNTVIGIRDVVQSGGSNPQQIIDGVIGFLKVRNLV